MNKIHVGIFGYGNLGKKIEQLVLKDERFELIYIFSRRNVFSKYGTCIESIQKIESYQQKIDIMFLCGGSSNDILSQAQMCIKNFNCIDAFDIHKDMSKHISCCNYLANKFNKVAFCGIGWDPGLFSMMRVLFIALGYETYTSWGKGISQGHSQALRQIQDVCDAVQYTIPNKPIIKKLKKKHVCLLSNKELHKRVCYVYTQSTNYESIRKKIISMPNYFAGFNTKVHFVSKEKLFKYKKMYHAGEVFCVGNNLNFKIKTNSNPEFTAKIMLCYSVVLFEYSKQKKYGAYNILDIPISHLLKNYEEFI